MPRSPPPAAIGARSTACGGEREPLLAFQTDSPTCKHVGVSESFAANSTDRIRDRNPSEKPSSIASFHRASRALGWQECPMHESSCVAPRAMLPPLPLGEVELQARERVKRMSVSRRKPAATHPLPAATASDLPRCAGEVTERNKPPSTQISYPNQSPAFLPGHPSPGAMKI